MQNVSIFLLIFIVSFFIKNYLVDFIEKSNINNILKRALKTIIEGVVIITNVIILTYTINNVDLLTAQYLVGSLILIVIIFLINIIVILLKHKKENNSEHKES